MLNFCNGHENVICAKKSFIEKRLHMDSWSMFVPTLKKDRHFSFFLSFFRKKVVNYYFSKMKLEQLNF